MMKITSISLLCLLFLIPIIPVFGQESSFDDQLVDSEKYSKLVNSDFILENKIKNAEKKIEDLEKINSELNKKIENLTSNINDLKDHGIKFGIDEEKLGQTIANNFLKNDKDWTNGDALVASSTIVAFFTLGSFLVIKFESDTRPNQLRILKTVFKIILVIQLIHILAMILIMMGSFTDLIYAGILVFTGYLLLLILVGVTKIVELENREKTKNVETTKSYDTSQEYFDEIRDKLRKQREEGE